MTYDLAALAAQIDAVACPLCGSRAGEGCQPLGWQPDVTPTVPHAARLRAAAEAQG